MDARRKYVTAIRGTITESRKSTTVIERDTATCGHCNRIILIKAGTGATTYLIPQVHGPDREEPGAMCRVCMRTVCLHCHADGRCTPLERRIEEMEARGRFLREAGRG